MAEQSGREKGGRQSWLTIVIVLMLVLGVFFRFVNLDRKVYWTDETYTSLRISGYTEAEFTRQVFNGKLVRAADLMQYQHPSAEEDDWADALNAFVGSAEHSPLYFVLARLWAQSVGSSIGAIRCLSALISLGVFPCLYWLCRELFAAETRATRRKAQSEIGGVALALVAVSPLHVLYAQEARQYSLLTVATLLSCAALLRAMRVQLRRSWVIYAASIAFGFYTHILFGLVAVAHALYVGMVEKLRLSETSRSYLWSSGAGLLLFAPWLAIVLANLDNVQASIATVYKADSLGYVVDRWLRNLSLVFVNQDLGAANLLLLLLAAVALYFLHRTAPRRVGLFVLLLVGATALPLVLPDLILGGQRSLRIRYLIPCYLGIQISIAYGLTTLAVFRGWQQKLGSLLLAALLAAGVWGCAVSSQAEVWWNKSLVRSGYYPDVARLINQTQNPLVISDSPPIDLLAFSHQLKPDVHLQLATVPGKIRVAPGFDPIFLFNPSARLRKRLANLGYKAVPAYRDAVVTRLWRLRRADL